MNSKRGAIEVEADGEVYTFRFSTNAMARYQDRAGETVTQAFKEIEAGSKTDDLDVIRLRRLVWAALSSTQDISEDDAGDVMDALGIQTAAQKLGEAVQAAFPEVKPGNARAPQARKRAT